MNAKDLQNLKEHLIQSLDALIKEGDADFQPNRKHHTQVPDEDEQPLTEMTQVIASSRNRRRTQELAQIKHALQRIEDDPEDFGLCDDCDQPIPLGRLKVKPWAKSCVACLHAKEHPHQSNRRRHIFDYHD